jgi:hypothetical protein
MLVGSVALAQQGLIVEPWRQAAVPAAARVPRLPAMPASGLGPSPAKIPERKVVAPPSVAPRASSLRWSPPVVELLVDPWAKGHVPAPAGSRWVPSSVEIVDPWADEAAKAKPRVASHQPVPQHSTIF